MNNLERGVLASLGSILVMGVIVFLVVRGRVNNKKELLNTEREYATLALQAGCLLGITEIRKQAEDRYKLDLSQEMREHMVMYCKDLTLKDIQL